MDLRYILTTIYSPIKTFEKIISEKPSLLDSLLMFGFIHILLLGIAYISLSFVNVYDIDTLISLFVGIPVAIFLEEPNITNFLISIGLGLLDISLFVFIVHLIIQKTGSKGSFSSLLMIFSLTQVVSIISIFGVLSLQNMDSPIFGFTLFSSIIGLFLWKFVLYFVGIRITYKSTIENTLITLISSYIIFSIISTFIFSFFFKRSVIEPLYTISRGGAKTIID